MNGRLNTIAFNAAFLLLAALSVPARAQEADVGSAVYFVVPGTVTGSPTPVDLDGDGKIEIVVPYMGMIGNSSGIRPAKKMAMAVDPSACVGAFNADGTNVAGWPVKIMTAEEHQRCLANEFPNWWSSTPAVMSAGLDGGASIAIANPSGPSKSLRGVSVIGGDGALQRIPSNIANPDPGTSLVLVKLNGKRTIVGGGTICTTDGKSVPGFKLPNGFCANVGDTNGDGELEVYLVTQRRGPNNASLLAFDHNGKPLPGWPQKIGGKSFAHPTFGNVFGDSKLEVILPDIHGHLLAWTCDGKPFGKTSPEAKGVSYDGTPGGLTEAQLEAEKCTSIFKDKVDVIGDAQTADLDGDGLDEIIVFDAEIQAVRAWHGDGSAVNPDSDIIADLKGQRIHGITVAGPDGAGAYDIFAGATWIHRGKDAKVTLTNMAEKLKPLTPSTPAVTEPIESTCADTITDLDGDGKADVLIGCADGRIVVFHSPIAFSKKWARVGVQ